MIKIYGLTKSTESRCWYFSVLDEWNGVETKYYTPFTVGLWMESAKKPRRYIYDSSEYTQVVGTCDFRVPESRSGVYKYLRRYFDDK